MSEDPTVRITLTLPLSLYNRINEHVAAIDTKTSSWVRELIQGALRERGLAKLEAREGAEP